MSNTPRSKDLNCRLRYLNNAGARLDAICGDAKSVQSLSRHLCNVRKWEVDVRDSLGIGVDAPLHVSYYQGDRVLADAVRDLINAQQRMVTGRVHLITMPFTGGRFHPVPTDTRAAVRKLGTAYIRLLNAYAQSDDVRRLKPQQDAVRHRVEALATMLDITPGHASLVTDPETRSRRDWMLDLLACAFRDTDDAALERLVQERDRMVQVKLLAEQHQEAIRRSQRELVAAQKREQAQERRRQRRKERAAQLRKERVLRAVPDLVESMEAAVQDFRTACFNEPNDPIDQHQATVQQWNRKAQKALATAQRDYADGIDAQHFSDRITVAQQDIAETVELVMAARREVAKVLYAPERPRKTAWKLHPDAVANFKRVLTQEAPGGDAPCYPSPKQVAKFRTAREQEADVQGERIAAHYLELLKNPLLLPAARARLAHERDVAFARHSRQAVERDVQQYQWCLVA